MTFSKPVVRSGLMNQTFLNVSDKPKLSKDEAAALIQRMKDYDAEMVTGIFHNREARGQGVRFSIHLYPGDDYDVYELFDGERYRIPRGVARHIRNCAYKQYADLNTNMGVMQGDLKLTAAAPVSNGRYIGGNNMMVPTRKEHRFSFESLEFSDDTLESFQSSLFMNQNDTTLPNIM